MLSPTPEQEAERQFRIMLSYFDEPAELAEYIAELLKKNPAGLRGLFCVESGQIQANIDVLDWIADEFPDASPSFFLKEAERFLV